jgi:hypothetical protein
VLMATRPVTQPVEVVSPEQLEEAFLALTQQEFCEHEDLRTLECMARDHLAGIEHPD